MKNLNATRRACRGIVPAGETETIRFTSPAMDADAMLKWRLNRNGSGTDWTATLGVVGGSSVVVIPGDELTPIQSALVEVEVIQDPDESGNAWATWETTDYSIGPTVNNAAVTVPVVDGNVNIPQSQTYAGQPIKAGEDLLAGVDMAAANVWELVITAGGSPCEYGVRFSVE